MSRAAKNLYLRYFLACIHLKSGQIKHTTAPTLCCAGSRRRVHHHVGVVHSLPQANEEVKHVGVVVQQDAGVHKGVELRREGDG